MKLVGVACIRDELSKGHLKRWLDWHLGLCDEIVVIDDGSTDGSGDYLREHGVSVLSGKGDFKNENFNTVRLFLEANLRGADVHMFFDGDEVLDKRLQSKAAIEDIFHEYPHDYFQLRLVNVWESEGFIRKDGPFFGGQFPRLFRTSRYLSGMPMPRRGLHSKNALLMHSKQGKILDYYMLHYGFFNEEMRQSKKRMYEAEGQVNPRHNWYVITDGAVVEPLEPEEAWR